MECVLCGSRRVTHFAHVHARDYLACPTCDLVFMAPDIASTPKPKKPAMCCMKTTPPMHVTGLSSTAWHSLSWSGCRLVRGFGLRFGTGADPFRNVRRTRLPDGDLRPVFGPDRSVLERRYDFITCTEAAEHFYSPAKEFARFDAMLKPGGWLGIMTETLTDPAHFADWWYVLEPSHVCFYRTSTFNGSRPASVGTSKCRAGR